MDSEEIYVQKKSITPKTFEYQVKLSNFSYFKKVLEKIIDKTKFEYSMKGIHFIANFTQEEVDAIQEQYGQEENYPVILEKNNKDQIKTVEFKADLQPCMQYIENKYLKEKKANEEIDYELSEYQIEIKNKKMNQDKFNDLYIKIKTEKDSIVFKEIPMTQIFDQSSGFFDSKDIQIKFFSSPFLQYLTKSYNLVALRMRDDKSSSKLSLSFSESESESDQSQYRNFEKFSHESRLITFGIDEQKLESCLQNLKSYTTKALNLNFSDISNFKNNNNNNNSQSNNQDLNKYNKELIKSKIQIFKKCFYKQFKDKLREREHTKGLRGEIENESEKSIRYRLDGDRQDILAIDKWCQKKIQYIEGEVFSTIYNDQFLEKDAKLRISNIAEKIKDSNKLIINRLEEATIFMYIRSPDIDQEIKNITQQLGYISKLLKKKLESEISSQLQNQMQIDEINNQIEHEKNKYCQIQKNGKIIVLIGSYEQIENTIKAINDYIKRNEVHSKLQACLKEIGQNIQESVVSCTQNQYQILQKETQFLQQIQQKYSVEIITDSKKLSDLGHNIKDLEVNSFHVKQQLAFSTVNPKLQLCLMCADIQNVHIDSLMINMRINGNYVDIFSPEIVNQTQCGQHVISQINQINAGTSKLLLDYEDSDDNDDARQIPHQSQMKKKENTKKKFQYCSVSHSNINFPIKHICFSVIKENKSNVKILLKKFFKKNENNFKIGIVIPKQEDLVFLYIQSLREILYDLYGRDPNKEYKQKNIFLFCEETQIQDIQKILLSKGLDQLILNKLSDADSIFQQNQKQYFINNELVPHEFHLLLDSFTVGKNRNEERFYAFLPKKVEQGVKLEKVKICIPTQENSQEFIIRENNRYSLESYLQNSEFKKEDVKDIRKAIKKAKEQKIESLYIYYDEDGCYSSELVRVNVKKRKITFQRNKQQYIEYQDKDIQQYQKLNFLYIIRGYNQEDIKEAQNQINSKLFINLKYFEKLWDYNYVDENIPKLLLLSKNNQLHKKTLDSFEKTFRKKHLKIISIEFIQNIALYQKFQEQVIQLHNKCKAETDYQEPMFYCNKDNSILEKIFKCNSIGFDPREHNNCQKYENRIFVANVPQQENNNNNAVEQCLACFVVKGKVLKQDFYSEQFINLKRLPKDNTDNQFYDCAQMEQDEEVRVAIFDLHRIYPAYLIKFQKNEESETNYTTDDQSKYQKKD
ncbi:hypothetical protein ABPG74_013095 [Tetrahymena malaccensis]